MWAAGNLEEKWAICAEGQAGLQTWAWTGLDGELLAVGFWELRRWARITNGVLERAGAGGQPGRRRTGGAPGQLD